MQDVHRGEAVHGDGVPAEDAHSDDVPAEAAHGDVAKGDAAHGEAICDAALDESRQKDIEDLLNDSST